MWWEYCKAVVLIVLIILAAYYTTKFIAARATGKYSHGTDIRIRSSMSLGRDKQIVIAEIGEKAYVLGVTAQQIELIDQLEKDRLEASLPKGPPAAPAPDFHKEFFERLKGTYQGPRLK